MKLPVNAVVSIRRALLAFISMNIDVFLSLHWVGYFSGYMMHIVVT